MPERARSSPRPAGRGSGAVRGVALLVVVVAALAAPGLANAAQTIVSLSFDDGKASQYPVRQVLASHGMHATFYIPSKAIGTAPGATMSWGQIHGLAADGNEIGGHTLDHVDLTTVSSTEATRQVCDDRSALIAQGFSPTSFAYPYGAANAGVEKIVKACGYSSARGVWGTWTPSCTLCDHAETIPPADPFLTRVSRCVDSTSLAEMQSYVTQAEQHGGGWIQICFHNIDNPGGGYDIPLQTFTAFLDWLQPRSGIGTVVRTVQQALGSAPQPPPPPPPPPPPSPDTTAPVTTIACNGTACGGSAYGAAVSVTLSASDSGSGVNETRYTTDGSDPAAASQLYTGAFSVAQTRTVKFRSWDNSGNVESVRSQTITIAATTPPPPPPPPPPPSPGGSGGGGRGGAGPDLALVLSAGSSTAAAGDTILYRVEVRLRNPAESAGASRVIVTDTLPEGTELTSIRVNRGPGCTGTSTLVCNLDFLAGDLVGVVEIVVRVAKAGTLVNTASVSALEADPDPANNTASLTITEPPAAFTPPTPTLQAPSLTVRGPVGVKAVRASQAGSLSTIARLVRVDAKATVMLKVRDLRSGKLLTLQPGSRLAEMTLKRQAMTARTRIAGARTFRLKVLLPIGQLRSGGHYQLELTATGVNGLASKLNIGFTR